MNNRSSSSAVINTVFVTVDLHTVAAPETRAMVVWAREKGAQAVFVLNKVDQVDCALDWQQALSELAAGAPVVLTSAKRGDGLDVLESALDPGAVVAVVGSRGVGKTTLCRKLSRGCHSTNIGIYPTRSGGVLLDVS